MFLRPFTGIREGARETSTNMRFHIYIKTVINNSSSEDDGHIKGGKGECYIAL